MWTVLKKLFKNKTVLPVLGLLWIQTAQAAAAPEKDVSAQSASGSAALTQKVVPPDNAPESGTASSPAHTIPAADRPINQSLSGESGGSHIAERFPPPPRPSGPEARLYPDFDPSAWKAARKAVATDQVRNLPASMVRVLPEAAAQVYLSSLDINRITCMGNRPVKDVVYSAEKGITTRINGSNAFVKLQLQPTPGGEPAPLDQPVELYVVCGRENDVYTLIGVPKRIPAQWVQLAAQAETLKQNQALFEGKPLETKLVTLMRQAWTDAYPESYTVAAVHRPVPVQALGGMDITHVRTVTVEGEGLRLKEYTLELKPEAVKASLPVLEKDFLRPELSAAPLAVTLDALAVRKGAPTRLFIVEQTDGAARLGQTPSPHLP